MGLSIGDFDIITMGQFMILQRRFIENMKMMKELESQAAYVAHINAHRKKGAKYIKMFEEDSKQVTEETVEEMKQDRKALFG